MLLSVYVIYTDLLSFYTILNHLQHLQISTAYHIVYQQVSLCKWALSWGSLNLSRSKILKGRKSGHQIFLTRFVCRIPSTLRNKRPLGLEQNTLCHSDSDITWQYLNIFDIYKCILVPAVVPWCRLPTAEHQLHLQIKARNYVWWTWTSARYLQWIDFWHLPEDCDSVADCVRILAFPNMRFGLRHHRLNGYVGRWRQRPWQVLYTSSFDRNCCVVWISFHSGIHILETVLMRSLVLSSASNRQKIIIRSNMM